MALSYPWSGRRNPLVIPSGAKRNQITIQSQSSVRDAFGGQISEWNPVLTTMAAIATVSSREMYQASQFTAQVTHMVMFDYPGSGVPLAGGMRVAFGFRTFLVQAVENVQERNRVIKLMCLEINGVI